MINKTKMTFIEIYESRARRLQLISAWPAHRQHYALHKWLKDNKDRYEQEADNGVKKRKPQQ